MFRLNVVASLLLILSITPRFFGQQGKDSFPKSSLWFNTMGPVTLESLNNKLTVVLISDMNCIECGYFAKAIETQTEQVNSVQFIEVLLPEPTHTYSRSEIVNFIQQNAYTHPIAIFSDLSYFVNSKILHVPHFLVYDKSNVPSISDEGLKGFDRVMEAVNELKNDRELSESYSSFKMIPEIPTNYWANPIIETPTYINAQEYGGGLLVNDVAHHRILGLTRNGEFESVAGSTVFPGLDNHQQGDIRFNHPSGMLSYNGKLYVADTYNNRLREIEHEKILGETAIGDGSLDSLALPTDVEFRKKIVYVTDALYNQVRAVNLQNRTSVVFANLPSKYVGMKRTYPLNLSAGKKGLYVVMSDGEVIILDKKGRPKTISTPGHIRFTSVCEWKGTLVATAPEGNAVYFKKGDEWEILTSGSDESSMNAGVLSLNKPFDSAIIGGELYVTDSYNHLIRIIHSLSDNVPHNFRPVLSDEIITIEPSHTFGEPMLMDTVYIADNPVAVKMKIDLQGFEILPGGQNYAVIHGSPVTGELLEEQITQDEIAFTVNPNQTDEMLYLEVYLTLGKASMPDVPIIKRVYLFIQIEKTTSAETIQELRYRPNLLPY